MSGLSCVEIAVVLTLKMDNGVTLLDPYMKFINRIRSDSRSFIASS